MTYTNDDLKRMYIEMQKNKAGRGQGTNTRSYGFEDMRTQGPMSLGGKYGSAGLQKKAAMQDQINSLLASGKMSPGAARMLGMGEAQTQGPASLLGAQDLSGKAASGLGNPETIPDGGSSNMTDEELKKMYADMLAGQQRAAQAATEAGVLQYEQQKSNIPKAYDPLRNEAYVNDQAAQRQQRERLANMGLSATGGKSMTLENQRAMGLQNALGNISRQQQQALDEISNSIANIRAQGNLNAANLEAANAQQYADARLNKYYQDRSFGENKRQFDTSFNENKRQFDTSSAENKRQFDATREDEAKKLAEQIRQYNQNFGEGQRQFDTSFNENKRQYDTSFGEGQRQYDLSRQDAAAALQNQLKTALLNLDPKLLKSKDKNWKELLARLNIKL